MPRSLRITEIYYDGQAPRTEGDEFIEIQNYGAEAARLGRVRIVIQSATARGPVAYGFPAKTTLLPDEVLVVAKNAGQFSDRFDSEPDFEARSSGSGYANTAAVKDLTHVRAVSRRSWALANTGATVALIGDDGTVLDAVAYNHDPEGRLGLRGEFPSAADGQSLRRALGRTAGQLTPSALQADTPSPGEIPPPPTPTPRPTPAPTPSPAPSPSPTPIPSPTAAPSPVPSPSPSPAPTPTAIPPTATPRPTPTPLPSPTPLPTAVIPTPPPPTPTVTALQCVTGILPQEPPRRVRVTGSVTEVRRLADETLVFIADACGGAILHLDANAKPPPVHSRLRFTALGARNGTQIDLYLDSGAMLERLPASPLPPAMPLAAAISQRAPTGTRVYTQGVIAQERDGAGNTRLRAAPGNVLLDPRAPAAVTGDVVFYGIIEWRAAGPILRAHYVAPAKPQGAASTPSLMDGRLVGAVVRHARDAVRYLLMRAATRGRANYLTLEIEEAH